MESLKIDRNEPDKFFADAKEQIDLEFVPTKTKKSKKGTEFPAPVVDKNTIKKVLDWLGVDTVVGIIRGEINKRAQVWCFDESIPDEGEPNAGIFQSDKFIEMARGFSARGEKMSELEEKLADLTDQLMTLASDLSNPETLKLMESVSNEYKSTKAAYESKKRPRKPKAEEGAAPTAVAA